MGEMEKIILEDSYGYGQPLVGWGGTREFFRHASTNRPLNPLPSDVAMNFIDSVYMVIEASRPIRIYRFFEEQDHWGEKFGRKRARQLGAWWSPNRPADHIDNLRLPSDLKESRHSIAVKVRWNRFDLVAEAILPKGRQVYFGRTARQTETVGKKNYHYDGGGVQLLMPRDADLETYLQIQGIHRAE